MQGLLQFVLAAATLVTLTDALPTTEQHIGSFEVKQVRNPSFKRNGPKELAKAYRKYGKELPTDLLKVVSAKKSSGNDGTVTTTPSDSYDSEYLTPVTIGGQTLQLDFDTGSSDLWVFSTSLTKADQSGHDVFSPSKSSTWKKLSGETWDISYGDGSSASGTVGTDTVTVGGTTVTKQAVEIATKISSAFVSDTNDGLLGLAFSSINTVTPTQQKTFFDNVKSSLDSPLFVADLSYHSPGTYSFGATDSSKYTGDITYVDVDDSQGFWEFTGTGYAVGSGSFKSSSIDTIADTGTTLIYLPTAAVTAYYKGVSSAKYDSSQGGYTFSCDADLPDLTLGLGDYKAVVPGEYINYAPISDGSSTCFGGVQRNTGIGMSIYGDVFLKSQYVVFDSTGPKLGFAAKST